MNDRATAGAGAAFSPRAVLALLLAGALAFVLLLYGLATSSGGNANDGQAHAGGTGLNGFAAIAALMAADGFAVEQARDPARLHRPGLLVITPPFDAKADELQKIVDARRAIGPTLVITPKWLAGKLRNAKAKRGWVVLPGAGGPNWRGFFDNITVALGKPGGAAAGGWRTRTASGRLPDDRQVLSGSGGGLIALVESGDGRMLAGYLDDQGWYPALDDFAGVSPPTSARPDRRRHPVVFVFEPDLLDNWGLADEATALNAHDLLVAAAGGRGRPIVFDLTLNGFGHSRGLIDLAFRPPFLAATLCLLMAALAVGWRAFCRFGPPRARLRSIAPGKTALVTNAAGLIARSGRVHLVATPYAEAARERLGALLRLPRGLDPAAIEAAIDHAQAQRGGAEPAFSAAAAALRAARTPHDLARRASTLQRIERAMTS